MKHLVLIFSLCLTINVYSQTCCSGGVPLSGNLGMPAANSGVLQFNVSYDLNVLTTLKSGREVIPDQRRKRNTHSVLLESGYSWNDWLSTDLFFSFVRQERIIDNNSPTVTNGIGDAVILLKFRVLSLNNNETTLFLATGPKVPLGAADKSINGITLNADLQPGSGAWDGIFWGQFSHVLSFRPSMSVNIVGAYNLKGKNKSYLGTNTYQFGHENQISLGISDRVLIGKHLIDPGLMLRSRSVLADRFNNDVLPSTGGSWIYLIPSLSYWANSDFSIQASTEIPIYANVKGTQLSPDYRINLGLYYKVSIKNK